MRVKEETRKAGLKLNIQKTKIMASGPITPWQIDGETIETVRDFILGGSKITADGDCTHEIKMCLLIGRTDTEALIIWPPDTKSWLIGKDLTLGKIEGQEKGVTGDDD